MNSTAFHADEVAAQVHAGSHARSVGIRDFLPEQHRLFFAQLPQIFLATTDAAGWPLATVLEGNPGFVQAPDPATLVVQALPAPGDPAAATLSVGQEAGLLGIDLATRRRNRANGVVSHLDADGFALTVQQSFGNCPQYIQRRSMIRTPAIAGTPRCLAALDEDARTLIAQADTFFVATRSRAGVGAGGGADISHRGGRPGFVAIDGDTLLIPDFRGNGYFNTLGNLLGEPRASLLFLDFESGDVLQLQGQASIDWSGGASFEGAERLWSFRVLQGWYRPQAATLHATEVEYAPTTLRTGTWTRSA